MSARATRKTDNELLEEISRKLTELTGVLGIAGRTKEAQVGYLVSMGFSNAEVSRISGIPKGTVDWIRAEAAKKEKGRKQNATPRN